MKIPIAKLQLVPYNAVHKGKSTPVEFGFADIDEAIMNKEWEFRSFQGCFRELQTEWESVDEDTSIVLQKKYHINRIATIADKGIWRKPLLLYNDYTILDGGHRLWACHYLKNCEVDAIVIEKYSLTDSEKETIWETIRKCRGDVKCALVQLRIEIIRE
ncbi:MAG: ParB N-terminal domain-containing protein [Deltaproteobacteria bacterium]|nr:ParB N-terminal domain-containing protein [Deltaproteobacteria bacterium]